MSSIKFIASRDPFSGASDAYLDDLVRRNEIHIRDLQHHIEEIRREQKRRAATYAPHGVAQFAADEIKRRRIEAGMSLRDLSEEIGRGGVVEHLGVNTLSKIQTNQRGLLVQELVAIAVALDCLPSDLLPGSA